jgi:hypothetical protein
LEQRYVKSMILDILIVMKCDAISICIP